MNWATMCDWWVVVQGKRDGGMGWGMVGRGKQRKWDGTLGGIGKIFKGNIHLGKPVFLCGFGNLPTVKRVSTTAPEIPPPPPVTYNDDMFWVCTAVSRAGFTIHKHASPVLSIQAFKDSILV